MNLWLSDALGIGKKGEMSKTRKDHAAPAVQPPKLPAFALGIKAKK